MAIYSPSVRREALFLGITDLQAYRLHEAREHLKRMEREPSRNDPQQCNACGAYTNGPCGCMEEEEED